MDGFKELKKFIHADRVCIDNSIFRICTKVSFVVLVSISLLITSRQYIGEPMECIVDDIPKKVMNSFCWFHSTYTLPNRLVGVIGRDFVQPGVASELKGGNAIKYHRYYQWVCFALFLQALCFYLPRYIWKCFEDGRLKVLCEDLKNPMLANDIKKTRKISLMHYFNEHLNQQNFYAYRFFLCEFLNFANAVGQVYFTNYFLDGEFMSYGIEVMREHHQVSPMTRVFPKVTKCTFHKYGGSGSIQKFDGLCVLAVNALNEKVYLFLWFWLFSLCILSGLALIYRSLICYSPKLRFQLLQTRARLASPRELRHILYRFKIGDWFCFYQLSKNIDPVIFKEICRDLSLKLYNIHKDLM